MLTVELSCLQSIQVPRDKNVSAVSKKAPIVSKKTPVVRKKTP